MTTLWCVSGLWAPLQLPSKKGTSSAAAVGSAGASSTVNSLLSPQCLWSNTNQRQQARMKRSFVVCMAPDEEKMTRRSPLDFPIEWERPKPGRRPDIFPQFSPMKTPLPPPSPADPPEEDEEEEEEKKEEEEEDPEKEEPDNPEKQ